MRSKVSFNTEQRERVSGAFHARYVYIKNYEKLSLTLATTAAAAESE
jgi:hypothetical protein